MKSDLPQEAALPAGSAPSALAPADNQSGSFQRPSDRVLRAQIELLGDDSDRVVAAVRTELSAGGARISRALERATHSVEPRLRLRARDLLASFKREIWLRRLIRMVSKPRINLESGLFLLGNLACDDFDARPYRRAMDAMAMKVRERAARESDPRRAALALPNYLGRDLRYRGALENYHHPDNIHLFRVIERRMGMPLTLSALYLLVARRAGIQAAPVALPGHVLMRLHFGQNRSVLIDPFQKGLIRSRADCTEYLRKCELIPQPEWFRDASDETLFMRHLMNLSNSNQMRGQLERARQLKRVAKILAHVQSNRKPVLRD